MKIGLFGRSCALLAVLSLLLCPSALLVGCAPNGDGEGEISFTDALGREVSLPSRPERVAALIGSFADVWCLAGGSLCAAAEDAFEDFGIEQGDAVNIGGAHSPSLELILSADPDLVLASASTASNVALLEPLSSAGITVAYFEVDNFEDYLSMLRICTDITGREDLYRKNGEEISLGIEGLKAEYAAENIPSSRRTVLLLRVSAGRIRAKGSEGTVLGEMLKDMGCINIADGKSAILDDLSVEEIMRLEPYRIFAVSMGNDTAAAEQTLAALLSENAAWASLGAVREGRVHMMDKTLFNLKPNARWAEAYGVLYDILTKE